MKQIRSRGVAMLNVAVGGEPGKKEDLLTALRAALAIADDLNESLVAIRISEAIDLCLLSNGAVESNWSNGGVGH